MKCLKRLIFSICLCLAQSYVSANEMNNGKTLTYSGINGLCNHLRTLASCSVLAEATNRELVVYWLHPDESFIIGNATWDDLFIYPKLKQVSRLPFHGALYGAKRPSDSPSLIMLQGECVLPVVTEEDKKNAVLHSNSPGAEHSLEIPDDLENVVIQTIHNIKPKSMSNETFLEKKRAFYKSLVPVLYVRKAVKKVSKQFTSKTVGVHIRTTDLLDLIWTGHRPAYWKYEREMKKEIEKDPETTFFISADKKQAIDYFLSQFGDRVIYYKGISYDQNGHTDRVSSIKSQRDALVDLYLLSKTSKLIGTKFSSFSYEAACIGGIPIIEEITH